MIPLGEVNVSEQNFLPIALQAKKKGVDSILTCLGTGQSARFAMQLRQIQFRPLILGCETLNSSREVELSAGALTGSWYASVQPSKEFRLRYTQRFNADTSIGGAAVHYELYKLLTELSPSNPSREEIRNKLLEIRARESVFGKFDILAQGGDQWFSLPITVTQITDK